MRGPVLSLSGGLLVSNCLEGDGNEPTTGGRSCGWNRLGMGDDLPGSALLDSAAHFLKVMEEQRLRIADASQIEPGYSRLQRVSICLIKKQVNGRACFLHQFDKAASQYQAIGGKCDPDETSHDAAARELNEEIGQGKLVHGRDFTLTDLTGTKPVVSREVSRTYGALTRYETYVFCAVDMPHLDLSKDDLWVSVDEMRRGQTSTQRKVAIKGWLEDIERATGQQIERLPDSFRAVRGTKRRRIKSAPSNRSA